MVFLNEGFFSLKTIFSRLFLSLWLFSDSFSWWRRILPSFGVFSSLLCTYWPTVSSLCAGNWSYLPIWTPLWKWDFSEWSSRCYPTCFIQENPLETAILSLFFCSIFFIPCYNFPVFFFLVGWPCYLSLCGQISHIIYFLPFWVLSNVFPSFPAQQDLWRISHSSYKGQNTNRTKEMEDIVSIVTWGSSMVFKSCPTFPL